MTPLPVLLAALLAPLCTATDGTGRGSALGSAMSLGCAPENTFFDCCYGQCIEGEGDCDVDADCAEGRICSQDVGANYGTLERFDVCEWPATKPCPPGSNR